MHFLHITIQAACIKGHVKAVYELQCHYLSSSHERLSELHKICEIVYHSHDINHKFAHKHSCVLANKCRQSHHVYR